MRGASAGPGSGTAEALGSAVELTVSGYRRVLSGTPTRPVRGVVGVDVAAAPTVRRSFGRRLTRSGSSSASPRATMPATEDSLTSLRNSARTKPRASSGTRYQNAGASASANASTTPVCVGSGRSATMAGVSDSGPPGADPAGASAKTGASRSASRLVKIVLNSAAPTAAPISRKKLLALVAVPSSCGSTEFCTASTIVCMTRPEAGAEHEDHGAEEEHAHVAGDPGQGDQAERGDGHARDRVDAVAPRLGDRDTGADRGEHHAHHHREHQEPGLASRPRPWPSGGTSAGTPSEANMPIPITRPMSGRDRERRVLEQAQREQRLLGRGLDDDEQRDRGERGDQDGQEQRVGPVVALRARQALPARGDARSRTSRRP